ncbi:hypothetical protein CEXT_499721 [Caerostris extrusa]|uniref:Uncharacterized protein n=1 Tax=Caerostris extrusa TaxID=172846 RepID=A0AAV4MVF8_CAEEX|nr:hypothetical protein CEXT_499721 [Caerostris extrusa]
MCHNTSSGLILTEAISNRPDITHIIFILRTSSIVYANAPSSINADQACVNTARRTRSLFTVPPQLIHRSVIIHPSD